jgi:hypothetical protein
MAVIWWDVMSMSHKTTYATNRGWMMNGLNSFTLGTKRF